MVLSFAYLYVSAGINFCNTGQHNCHTDAICTPTLGGFHCQCAAGFTGNGTSCQSMSKTRTEPRWRPIVPLSLILSLEKKRSVIKGLACSPLKNLSQKSSFLRLGNAEHKRTFVTTVQTSAHFLKVYDQAF